MRPLLGRDGALIYNNLGFHGASLLVGILAIVLTAAHIALSMKSPAIRAKSPFMLDATSDEEGTDARRESMDRRASLDPRERRGGAVLLPWSTVRTVEPEGDAAIGRQSFGGCVK